MTVVEELVSVLGLEIGSDVMSTLAKFQATVSKGLAGLSLMGGVAAAAFAGVVVSVAHAGDEIGNMAEQLGVSTDALQEMKYAADQSDVTFETLTSSLKFMSKNAFEAATGSKEAMEAFAGVQLRDANGLKDPAELLMSVADRFKTLKDPIQQTNLAMKIFGRGGMAMIPMLKTGGEELRAFMEDAHALGYVLDKETIEASDRFDKSFKRLRSSLEGVRNKLGAPFVDAFGRAMFALSEIIRKNLLPFVEKRLVPALKEIGRRFGGVIDVVRSLGSELASIGSKLTDNPIVRALMQLVGAAVDMEMVKAAVIGLGVVLVATGLAAAASWLLAVAPFIALAVLIGLIVDDIRAFVQGGNSVIGMVEKWGKAFNPDDSPVIAFFKSAIALLFDLTDPAKWKRMGDAAVTAVMYIGKAIKDYISNSSVGQFLSSAANFISDPLGPDRRAAAKAAIGGAVDPFGMMGLGPTPETLQGNFRGSFGAGASSPDASAVIAPRADGKAGIVQSNTFNVNATGLTAEQAKAAVKEAVDDANREAHEAVGGGH